MKKTVGEINFNSSYLNMKVCNCSYDEDDWGELHRWCPINCPLRNRDTEQCLVDLLNERAKLDSKIKKFANVEIEVDEEYLRKLEKIQSKGFFVNQKDKSE